ncbi:uncharacterized protein V1510DRAFT_368516, partial [Dipodascopsis tothii]|uniref:uncharacterized protein n=1 Tax=Dipodascopsis tothii TaxID=44089 RepID=UPI0034CE4D84
KVDLEPNPFEQSFASKEGATSSQSSQKALLPPVAALASPSAVLGNGNGPSASFNWGLNSLRSGPLSPAMLQGPQAAGIQSFEGHLRTGLTPNESGIRTGLTPGGSGTMFPPAAASPLTAAIFSLMPPTPGGLQVQSLPQSPHPLEQQENARAPNGTARPAPDGAPRNGIVVKPDPFGDSANAAASGLFLLSQGQQQKAQAAAQAAAAAKKGAPDRKRAAGGRKNARKSETAEPPTKRSKIIVSGNSTDDDGDGERDGSEEADSKKMSEEDKRKNFLERNRVAALKCRQRKKQWLANLQAKVEYYGSENDALNAQVTALREQVVSLKAILLAHKDCSATRALPPGQDPINIALGQDFVSNIQQMPPQHMGAPAMSNLPSMAGGRRYL